MIGYRMESEQPKTVHVGASQGNYPAIVEAIFSLVGATKPISLTLHLS